MKKSASQSFGTREGLVRWLGSGLCALALAGAGTTAVAAPLLSTSYTFNGAVATLNVNAVAVTDLYAYQFDLSFDTSVLSAASVTEGPFLASGGSTFFDGGLIDNATGQISFVFGTLMDTVPGVDGSGVLATISFDVLAPSVTSVNFSNVVFLNSALQDIDVEVRNAVLSVQEPSSAFLLGVGLVGLVATVPRRKKLTAKLPEGTPATA